MKFGFPTWSLTLVFAIFISGIMCALLLAPISDRVGLRPTLVTACALALIGALLFLSASAFGWLIAASYVQGLGVGLYQSTVNVAMVELVPAGRYATATLGSSRMGTLGLASGPLLAGLLGQYGPGQLRLIYLVELLSLGVLLLALLRLGEIGTRPAAPEPPNAIESQLAIAPFVLYASVFVAFASGAFLNAVGSTLVVTWLNVSNLAIGGTAVTLLFISSAIAQSWVVRLPASVVLRCGLVVAAAGLLAAALALADRNAVLMLAAVVVVGAGQGGAYAGSLARLNMAVPPGLRAAATSRYYFCGYAGAGLPVLASGWALAELGIVPTVVLFAGGVGLAAVVVVA